MCQIVMHRPSAGTYCCPVDAIDGGIWPPLEVARLQLPRARRWEECAVQRCCDVAVGWTAYNPCDREGQGLLDSGCGTYDKKMFLWEMEALTKSTAKRL